MVYGRGECGFGGQGSKMDLYLKLTGEKQSQKIIVASGSKQCLTHREQTLQKHKNGGSNIHRGKWRNRKQQGTQMELIRENKTKEVGKPK